MRYITCFILFLSLGISILAQDKALLYSHYDFNGLAINPAYSGSHEMLSMSFTSRYQWIGFEGAPSYLTFSAHTPFKNTRTGLGILVLHESIGIRSYTGIYFNYAYRITMGKGKLALGLKGGIASGNQQTLDLGNDDNVFSDKSSHYLLPNFGFGTYFYTKKFFAGFSVPLIFSYKTNENGSIVPYHDFKKYAYYATTGVKIDLIKDWQLQPSTLWLYQIGQGVVFDAGCNVLYKDILKAGLAYRNKGVLIMLMDIKLTYQWHVGFAYDFGMGGINEYNKSSFEIAMQYDFGYRIKASDPTLF